MPTTRDHPWLPSFSQTSCLIEVSRTSKHSFNLYYFSLTIPPHSCIAAPAGVTNITTHDVTATSVLLVWEAPVNVPKNIAKNYEISDPDNGITQQAQTETIRLDKLTPFFKYNISIVADVTYNKTDFGGNESFHQFLTDAAAPDAVQSVVTTQVLHSNMLEAVWTQPKVAHGRLDYYEVFTWDHDDKLISNM